MKYYTLKYPLKLITSKRHRISRSDYNNEMLNMTLKILSVRRLKVRKIISVKRYFFECQLKRIEYTFETHPLTHTIDMVVLVSSNRKLCPLDMGCTPIAS